MAPRLSVVVPVHNVERYLDECLNSLARQSFRDLEVVMVDDGSTDGSAVLARRFADRDPRFRLVGRANGGLGAARNTGVSHSDPAAEFIAFADSDDVVPRDAYEVMVAALEESGSDFVSGSVMRLFEDDGRLQQHPLFTRPMATTRLRTHVTRELGLASDRIACNKVFRKAFWAGNELRFPEGVLYEDVPVIVPAHFLARSVDVLSSTVYHWRHRAGSITRNRTNARAIRDRAAAVTSVSGFLAERAGRGGAADGWARYKRAYDASVLTEDFWYFMEVLPDGDSDYHEAFLEWTNAFVEQVDPVVLDGLPLRFRVKWQLVRERRIEDLLAFLDFEKRNPHTFAVRGIRRRRAAYPGVRSIPRDLLRLERRKDFPLVAHLREAVWHDGKLRLRGYAYVRNLPVGSRLSQVTFAWLRGPGRQVLPLRMRTVEDPAATAGSRQGLHSYDWAGFETVVDPRRLFGRTTGATWRFVVGVGVLGRGVLVRGGLGAAGALTAPAVHYADEDTRVVPFFEGGTLRLRAERVRARLERHSC